MTLDGHRNDDFKPYVFMTTNFGENWKSISRNLPLGGTVNVIREHHRNPNLLFIGTERGAYFTIDRGAKWTKFKGNFPTVPVDDIAIHPRENDLIFGTHGRSIWILDDITPLEHLTEKILASPSFLFDVRPATIFNSFSHKGSTGHKIFVAQNPPFGAIISYYLKLKAKDVKIIIKNEEGKKIRELKGKKDAGINRITWDLRYEAPKIPTTGQRGRQFRVSGPYVLPGKYQIILETSGQEAPKSVQVEGDPRIDISFEERKAQHDTLLSIHKLFPALFNASQTIDNISKTISNLEQNLKTLPEIPDEITKQIKSITKETDDIRKKLLGDPQLGFRGMRLSVRGSLINLSRSISGYTGAPSEYQTRQIKLKLNELNALIARINKIIKEDVPRLNKLLNEKNIPHIFFGEIIKKDKK